MANVTCRPGGPGSHRPDPADPLGPDRVGDEIPLGPGSIKRSAALAGSRGRGGERRPPKGAALTLLDAQAIVAALTGEPAADEVEVLLRDETDPAWLSAVNLAETLDVLVRHQGWPVSEVEEKLRWLTLGGLRILPIDESIGLSAGRLHARHYQRDRRPLSMADCVALASAIGLGERLASSDPALLATAVDEGCQVLVLPDSKGQRTIIAKVIGGPEQSDES